MAPEIPGYQYHCQEERKDAIMVPVSLESPFLQDEQGVNWSPKLS